MRGKFLILMAVCVAVLVGSGTLGPSAQAQRAKAPSIKKTVERSVGAALSHRADLTVEREDYTLDGTYGFTLWEPEERETSEHGGTPVVRVAIAPDMKPGQIEGAVRSRLEELSDVPARRQDVRVGKKRYKGVAVGPIPGSTPSVEVYVPVQGRVYQINLYREKLDAEGKKLLAEVEFSPPSRPVSSLDLPEGEDGKTLQTRGDPALVKKELEARRPAEEPTTSRTTSEADTSATRTASAAQPTPVYEEYRMANGCWRARSTFPIQTQHGAYANGTGWTQLGVPNYWGQYTHGNLGYGRCNNANYTNDYHAIDYPLRKGDVVFSPFAGGTVTFAGRNSSHKNYGIFVVIRSDNGKYYSMSAHLNGLARGIVRGARVNYGTIIGFAGDSGDPSIPVGQPHLHQAFYRYPRLLADGSPYGGAGLQVLYHRFTGTAAKRVGQSVDPNSYYNVYYYGAVRPNYQATCREGIVCGEGYRVSN